MLKPVWCYNQVKMSNIAILEQISEFFGWQTAKNDNYQKILFEPSSGTKMAPKMRGATKIYK